MSSLVIEDISEETHRGLKLLATEHGRSIEAEVHAILDAAVITGRTPNIGTALAELGARFGGIELDITRDQSPVRVATFD